MTSPSARHRFILEGLPEIGDELVLDAERSHQLARVLRLRAGERIVVCDGQGSEGEGELLQVDPRRCRVLLSSRQSLPRRSALLSTLYLPLIRPQRFDWAVEKAVELGVAGITPLLTERTTHGSADLGESRLQRWCHIVREAAEQCGSAHLPLMGGVRTFEQALAEPCSLRLLACERQDQERTAIAQLPELARRPGEPLRVALFVGPEGGFSPREFEAALAAACRLITLGPRILRTETAALVMLAQILGCEAEQAA